MEKVRIRKIIEDIIITQFLNSEIDIIHEEDVTFKELGLDSVDQIELVKTVAPALGVIDQLPIADTLKKLKGDDKK